MPVKGTKEPDSSLAALDNSAEVSEKDLKPGQRMKSGQDVKIDEE